MADATPQANLTYVLWTASFNSTFLLGYLLVESALVIRPDAPPCPALLEAINANGLVIFLVANLLTGFVNLSIKTMYAGNGLSMAVLLAYSAGVCAFAWTIRKRRIKL
jgi:phosphatidylinositol glycan class W